MKKILSRLRRDPGEPASETAYRLLGWWLGLVVGPTLVALVVCVAVRPAGPPPVWLAVLATAVVAVNIAGAVVAAVGWSRA